MEKRLKEIWNWNKIEIETQHKKKLEIETRFRKIFACKKNKGNLSWNKKKDISKARWNNIEIETRDKKRIQIKTS